MSWKQQLDNWSTGTTLKYPPGITKSFYWETSACDKAMTNKYEEVFIQSNVLDKLQENYTPFKKYIANNKYAVAFDNLSGDTRLIIPVPSRGHSYATLKHFIDQAPVKQQQMFWKKVAEEVHIMLQTNDKIYVSTHGLGVPYLHVRLEAVPKYYQSELAQ